MADRTTECNPIVGVLPVPPREVFVDEGSWHGGSGATPSPVELVGVVIYEDGTTASVIIDNGSAQVISVASTCDDERWIDWAA